MLFYFCNFVIQKFNRSLTNEPKNHRQNEQTTDNGSGHHHDGRHKPDQGGRMDTHQPVGLPARCDQGSRAHESGRGANQRI